MFLRGTIAAAALLAAVSLSFPQTQTNYNQTAIAVLDFKNLSKIAGFDFLSKSISESVTTSLQKTGKFKLVERERLSAIIAEQKLVLSGVIDDDLPAGKKIGALAMADALVLGSYSVIGDMVEVNARLVRVDSGEVVLAERINEKMGDNLFAKIAELGETIANRLLNVRTGLLDLDTSPQGATVKSGDTLVGVTPIVEKSLSTGAHTFVISLEGYELRTVTVDIREGRNSINFPLEKKALSLPSKISFYVHLIQPMGTVFQTNGTNFQPDWGISYEYLWNGFSFGVDFGGLLYFCNSIDYSAPGVPYTNNAVFYFHKLDALFKYHFFSDSRWFSPYLGVGLGMVLYSPDNNNVNVRFYYKPLIGITVFPTGRFSFYIEAIYHDPGTVTISQKKFNLFGGYTLLSGEQNMNNLLIGAGVCLNF